MTRPPDIEALDQALLAVSEDARSIVDGLGEVRGTWRAAAGEWSVAECFDHLAVGNRVYLAAMEPSARRARERGRGRRGPARATSRSGPTADSRT